jgi:hypothetical protein
MILAWYDPTNHHVSTDKHDPLFTPLGQLWPLHKIPLQRTYENGYNFTVVEMDWVVRGLFALHKQQPPEAAAIQQLINKLANTVYQLEPLTDEEIIETCDTWVVDDIGSDEVIKIVRRTELAHGIGEKE